MKSILLVFVLLANCAVNPAVNSSQNAQKVNRILDDWHRAAAEANFDAYFNKMDKNSVFVGTDAAEVWHKKEFQKYAKPFFDKGKAWRFKSKQRHLYFDKRQRSVWFDELLETWMGECRGSGVLTKKNGKWLIQHYVLSLVVPNEQLEQIIPILKRKVKKTKNNSSTTKDK